MKLNINIPFNKPYFTQEEIENIRKAISLGVLACGGHFTQACSNYFEQKHGFKKAFLTKSCTDALELSAMLCNIGVDDQVIVPSFTYVSTALAFTKFGAKVRFVDSLANHPDMDCNHIENLITPKTKAIVVVHYNGVSCDMQKIELLAKKYNLYVIEDAAHAINNYDCGRVGDLVCYSFHETKNIHCTEGGMLGINNKEMTHRAEKLLYKGTNRKEFDRKNVSKYEWVDTGGSYALSELNAAFLWGQIEYFDNIIRRRHHQWRRYYNNFVDSEFEIPLSQGSSHVFYIICKSKEQRDCLIGYLLQKGILSTFHYQALHLSPMGERFHDKTRLPNAERFSDTLLRLPLFYELSDSQIDMISEYINE